MRSANPLLVVIDPAARARDAESARIAVDVLRAAERLKIVLPNTRAELDHALARGAHGRTVVIGADGTLHAVVASLRSSGRLATSTLGLVPVGEHERHARGCCLAGTLGLPAGVASAARVARGPVFRRLDLLVDDDGGIAVGRVRVGVPAWRRARLGRPPRPEALAIPRQADDPGLRVRLAHAGAVARANLSAGLSGIAVAAAAGAQRGWHLQVEADGRLVCGERQRVTAVELGTETSPPPRPGGGSDMAAGYADVLVTLAGRPADRSRDWPAELLTLRARRVLVHGQDFPCSCDDRPTDTVSRRAWTVEPAAWRLAVPA